DVRRLAPQLERDGLALLGGLRRRHAVLGVKGHAPPAVEHGEQQLAGVAQLRQLRGGRVRRRAATVAAPAGEIADREATGDGDDDSAGGDACPRRHRILIWIGFDSPVWVVLPAWSIATMRKW